MQMKQLSNIALIEQMGRLVQTERKITQQILECIAEIDRRKLYLERAYSSLFDFLIKEYGYSAASAYRRVAGARLLREIPEVSEKIRSGALNLTQLSQVQQSVRNVQTLEKRKVNVVEKLEVLKRIEFANQKTTEIELAKTWAPCSEANTNDKTHRDESVSITIHLSKDEIALLEQVRDMVSHSVPSKKWSEVILHLAMKEMKARSTKKGVEVAKTKDDILEAQISKPSTIKPSIKKHLLTTKSCQYKDPQTNTTCGSKRFLQIDHIHPRWAAGGNELSNLQVLCSQHNRHKYNKELGHSPP